MNIAKIINFDTGNARGLSVVVFVSGCTNGCLQCHNPETWDFSYGEPLTEDVLNEICAAVANPHIKNLVISGGDPLHPDNLEGTYSIINEIFEERQCNGKNIILYTGYTFENLKARALQEDYLTLILNSINILIDGPYDYNLKTKGLDYRGSTNQRAWQRRVNELGYYFADISNEYFKETSK